MSEKTAMRMAYCLCWAGGSLMGVGVVTHVGLIITGLGIAAAGLIVLWESRS